MKVKKNRKETREFKQLKEQLIGTRQVVSHTKVGNLWTHEASVRKKLKQLHQMDGQSIKGFDNLLLDYRELLDQISQRLLQDYNEKNHTNFDFEDYFSSLLKWCQQTLIEINKLTTQQKLK